MPVAINWLRIENHAPQTADNAAHVFAAKHRLVTKTSKHHSRLIEYKLQVYEHEQYKPDTHTDTYTLFQIYYT